jgi:hypothetical protein
MAMLPRNMISPMVSPSCGTGCMVSGSSTGIALQVVAHALAGVQAGALADVELVPGRMLGADGGRAVDLGQAVDMGQVEAHGFHAFDHRGRGAAPATMALTPAGTPASSPPGR